MGNLFTIGHSTMPIEDFVGLLRQHSVNCVVDVRSTPFSKYASQFNKDDLRDLLNDAGIKYYHMGKNFGARQTDKPELFTDGQLDFEKVRSSDDFKKGFDSIVRGLALDNNIALMCTEKDPISCHRTIMVARAFELAGVDVNHILSDGNLETQDSVNHRLLEKFFPDREQTSLFSGVSNEEELLTNAYRLQNKEIGFKFGFSDFEG